MDRPRLAYERAIGFGTVLLDRHHPGFAKDIRNIKVKARKGWGILNKGRAIIVARNISAMPSYDPTVRFVHEV